MKGLKNISPFYKIYSLKINKFFNKIIKNIII